MTYQERFRLDGELAVVTGGGRAIGLCCVEALAEAGARVVVIERNEADAAEALALRQKGYDIDLLIGDVANSVRVEAMAQQLAFAPPQTIIRNRLQCQIPANSETLDTNAATQAVQRYLALWAPKLAQCQIEWLPDEQGFALAEQIQILAEQTAHPSTQKGCLQAIAEDELELW